MSFLGGSIVLSLLWAAHFESIIQQALYLMSAWCSTNYLFRFRDFLKPLSCLLSELEELPCKMGSFTSLYNGLFYPPVKLLHPDEFPSKIEGFSFTGNCLTTASSASAFSRDRE